MKDKKLDVDVNDEAFQSIYEYAHISFISLVSKCDVWKISILHVNYNSLLAPWDPCVFVHNGRIRRLVVIMVNESVKVFELDLEEELVHPK